MVIKGATVVNAEKMQKVDVRIENGKITEIGSDLEGKVLEAHGKYLLPAMIDIGVMVNDRKLRGGTIEKLSKKAHINGFGTVVLSSLCTPPVDNEITLEFVKSQAELCADTEILTLLSGVDMEGGLSDCSILIKDGAVGIEFESHIDGNLIRRLMEYALMYGIRLFCHANDPALQGDGVMHEGEISSYLGLSGIPMLSESSQVARIGEFAKYYGVETVILGASTPESLDICDSNDYLKPQVSLHHLLLSDSACDNYETSGKIWPPLRDESSRKAMVNALKEGKVYMTTSLHSPVSKTAKDAVFADAAFGVDGLTNFLPLFYTNLVKSEVVDLTDFVRLTSVAPSEVLGVQDWKGKVAVGYDADLILFDPRKRSMCHEESSPYLHQACVGFVEKLAFR